MKLIAESGATKTDWRLIADDGTVRSAYSAGLNPSVLDVEQMREIIAPVMPVLNPEGKSVEEIFFYGAGLVSDAAAAPLAGVLSMWYPFAQMQFHSDMLAAARALFGNGSGVVAIMGTGSNSCLYKNGVIVKNIRPGGYVLGDEGSGVALGRAFLSDLVKGLLPESIEAEFTAQTGLDYSGIVRKVYKEPAASAFMASLAPFVLSHIEEPCMNAMVRNCLESFVKRALSRYGDFAGDKIAACKVGVVGSFGCACEEMLREIGQKYGLEFVAFLKSPIDQLVIYHSNYGI
jgi:N-acetylglucosamine kinase-like BadF-type ATPase